MINIKELKLLKAFRLFPVLIAPIVCASLSSCQHKQKGLVQTTSNDSTLQVKSTSILESKLSEINVLSGQVIVMEVQTGRIKALVGLERITTIFSINKTGLPISGRLMTGDVFRQITEYIINLK